MRNILLASTALVAVAGVTAASADVAITGNSAFIYQAHSDNTTDAASTGANNTQYGSDSDLLAKWSTTTDSGLTVSVAWDIDVNDSTGSIAGDFGTIAWADAGDAAGDSASADADPAEDEFYGTLTPVYDGREDISGGSISYTSPDFNGFTFSIGSTNGGTSSAANETSYSVAYSAAVNGADVSVGYASASEGNDNTSSTGTDRNSTSLNGSVTMGALTIEAAMNASKTTRVDGTSAVGYTDFSSSNFGITYALNDQISLIAQSIAADGKYSTYTDYKFDETAYTVSYEIASGVMLYGTFTDYSQSGAATDTSGTGTVINLTVSF